MADLSALRVEARKKRALATRKVARLRRVNEVDIAGSSFDPRRQTALPRRYTEAQLKAYISSLDTFLSRSTQYYRGTRGTVITKPTRDAYMRAQRRVNQFNQRQFSKIRDITLPGTSMTIEERIRQLAPRRMGSNLAANRPYDPIHRTTRSITSERAAKKLTADLEMRATPEYAKRSRKVNRDTFNKMMDDVNDETLRRRVNSLSDRQFDLLWGYTDFTDNVAIIYDLYKGRLLPEGRNRRSMMSTGMSAAEDFVTWAEQQSL